GSSSVARSVPCRLDASSVAVFLRSGAVGWFKTASTGGAPGPQSPVTVRPRVRGGRRGAPPLPRGQTVTGCCGTVDHPVDAVFNHPTPAESWKVATLDASNRLRQLERTDD
ncbi:hypothetical protein PYK79_30555, partial [Streptomyces sp. ID05-04B]|nr:hypothetical protein [Streptomyces sp. ID05-04B]